MVSTTDVFARSGLAAETSHRSPVDMETGYRWTKTLDAANASAVAAVQHKTNAAPTTWRPTRRHEPSKTDRGAGVAARRGGDRRRPGQRAVREVPGTRRHRPAHRVQLRPLPDRRPGFAGRVARLRQR